MLQAQKIWLFIFATFLVFTPWAYQLEPGWNATKFYPPNDWTTGYEGQYKSFYLDYGTENQTMISSDNGKFCLAMYEFASNPQHYYLTIVIGCNVPGAGIPVWIANRNSSCIGNYTFKLGTQYLLYNNDTTKVWTSVDNIGSAEIDDSGNWILQSISTEQIAWQSFDEPADILLPGQTFTSSLKLTSRSNLSTAETGTFIAVVEESKFVLYLSSNNPQPYFREPSAPICNLTNPVATYQNYSLKLSSGAGACSQPIVSFPLPQGNSRDNLQLLRLESDGNLISYTLESSNWSAAKLFNNKCKLPLGCGRYGLCISTTEQCQCLATNNGTVESGTLTDSRGKCVIDTTPAPCDYNTQRNNHFIQIQGKYFYNRSTPGTRDECKETCLYNCSCQAYFYSNNTCYILDEIVGSLIEDVNVDGFLKFRNRDILKGLQTESRAHNWRAIVAGVAGGALFCLVLLMLARKLMKTRKLIDEEINKCLFSIEGLPPRFSSRQLEAATNMFCCKLGRGSFGSVYKGTLPNGKKIAVKTMESTGQGAKQFVAEVASMANISHVNIVHLCGFCIEHNHQMLVYDFMPNGSLDHWIFNDQEGILSWGVRMNIAIGTARGLAYLHDECREPIIHFDVKPQNILLDEKFVAKVADFGMAKQVNRDASKVMTNVRGTPGYLAPEWLTHSIATKKCDVYSFGMVLLEIIGGRKNLDILKIDTDLEWYFPAWAVNKAREGNMMDIIDPKIRPFVLEQQGTRIIQVALWCIQENILIRPSMREVVQMLEGTKEVELPPLSFRFNLTTQQDQYGSSSI